MRFGGREEDRAPVVRPTAPSAQKQMQILRAHTVRQTSPQLKCNNKNNCNNKFLFYTVRIVIQKKKLKIALLIASIFFVVLIATIIAFYNSNNGWATIKKDMNILPYQPTKTEIDSLEGIWLCYTGSPQARISDPNRYHKVVPNLKTKLLIVI